MSRFYRVSRFAVSTEKNTARSSVGVGALPNERNSTSDSWRCFRIDHRDYGGRRQCATCRVAPLSSLTVVFVCFNPVVQPNEEPDREN